MRVVADTNILISALLTESALPHVFLMLWLDRRFDLVTSEQQFEEIGRVTRYPKLRSLLQPSKVGRLVNDLREGAVVLDQLPKVTACADPSDNFVLAMVEAGNADALVTGDVADLLSMKRHAGAPIQSVRQFLESNRLIASDRP